MGAPLAASVNMRPRYAGVGKLRRSDEAYFQAYLSLWARRILTLTRRISSDVGVSAL